MLTRRSFLHILAASGLLPHMPLEAASPIAEARRWQILAVLQQQLLPSEPNSPGASDINALGYLRFVLSDPWLRPSLRTFLVQGVDWLEEVCQQQTERSFTELDETGRDAMLQQVASTQAGERWLASHLLFLTEALLTDPAYGGNRDETGWQWLGHTPGFPRPDAQTRYPALPL